MTTFSNSHPTNTNKIDRILNLLAFFFLLGMFANLVLSWSSIPNTVPVHFNFWGEPDSFGAKGTLFILPCIGVGIFVLLIVLHKYLSVLNSFDLQQKKISQQKKEASEIYTRSMLSWHNFLILAFFFYLENESIQIALEHKKALNPYALLIFILSITVTMIYYIVRIQRVK